MTGKVVLLGFFAFPLTSVSAETRSEKDAILDIDPRRRSMWHLINPTEHGDVGHPTGYEIMPGATASPICHSKTPHRRQVASLNTRCGDALQS